MLVRNTFWCLNPVSIRSTSQTQIRAICGRSSLNRWSPYQDDTDQYNVGNKGYNKFNNPRFWRWCSLFSLHISLMMLSSILQVAHTTSVESVTYSIYTVFTARIHTILSIRIYTFCCAIPSRPPCFTGTYSVCVSTSLTVRRTTKWTMFAIRSFWTSFGAVRS